MGPAPPFAGIVTAAEAQREGLTVAEATGLLHRFAYIKQRLSIAAATFLPSTPEWEVKCALALHGWLDAEHATLLYNRIAELREPAPTAADIPAEALCAALDEALAARSTAARLGALYGALRPALRSALESYLARTNPLCDQPTVRVLRMILAEEDAIVSWTSAVRAAADRRDWTEWQRHVETAIAAAGVLELFNLANDGGVPPAAWLGVAVAGVTGYVAIAFLLRMLHRSGLSGYGIYCLALGVLALVAL